VKTDCLPQYKFELVLNTNKIEINDYFGTILNALCGPIELIDNGVQGFLLDQRELNPIVEKINLMAADKNSLSFV
jgi:hypothetical protein